MQTKGPILLLLASLVMQGCTTLPAPPATPAAASFQRINSVLPDFVYGYPMHY